MDPRYIVASLEAFSDMLPAVYAVSGVVWLAALDGWVGETIVKAVKPGQPARETLTLSER